jgi:flagellar motor switch protein FliN/FliY
MSDIYMNPTAHSAEPTAMSMDPSVTSSIPSPEEPQATIPSSAAPSASASPSSGSEVPISMLLDLSLPVSIELGRTSMTVQEILRLGRGSVIQLDRLAGEPIDVIVGDRRFAEGEVVILGETFGVRITRILPRTAAEEFAS